MEHSDRRVPPLRAYIAHLERGELPYQACGSCGERFFYPRLLCPACGATEVDFHASSGLGTIYSRTVVHARDEAPFNVVLVDLEEGFRIMSRVEDVPNKDVRIGMKVRLKYIDEPAGDGLPSPVFAPAGDA